MQELRGLEVEREALLFQVDVLQDTLEGVEELLAEAQREAGQASSVSRGLTTTKTPETIKYRVLKLLFLS